MGRRGGKCLEEAEILAGERRFLKVGFGLHDPDARDKVVRLAPDFVKDFLAGCAVVFVTLSFTMVKMPQS
jgi:hypothetical protein